MGYLDFHMTYMVPPLAVVWVLVAEQERTVRRRTIEAAVTLAALATLWATPWDNYMVATGVWDYPADGVVATVGYIPVEEQLFFVLQPLLTVGFLSLLRDGTPSPVPDTPGERMRWTGWGLASLTLLVSLAAAAFHFVGRAPYLTAIVGWFGPVAALQVAVGWPWLAARWRLVTAAILAPTFYLGLVDAIAIDRQYWQINPDATVGVEVAGLPLEEALFFLVTNAIVVGGALLYLDWYAWLRGEPNTAPPSRGNQ